MGLWMLGRSVASVTGKAIGSAEAWSASPLAKSHGSFQKFVGEHSLKGRRCDFLPFFASWFEEWANSVAENSPALSGDAHKDCTDRRTLLAAQRFSAAF